MTVQAPQIHIGTSGFQYDHWQGIFYPQDLPKTQWFAHYHTAFNTVEINNTFYHLPKSETFAAWREKARPGFCYALKFSRYGSHLKKLKDPEEIVGNFMSAASSLEDRLGPILVQLPPNWTADPERLHQFLACLPPEQRIAVEVRDPTWLNDRIFEVLKKHSAALCIHDMIANHPHQVTAGWVYYRFHGRDYGGNYSHQKLSAVADRLAAHHQAGRDVYVYFNNDLDGHAIHNALDLQRYVDDRIAFGQS